MNYLTNYYKNKAEQLQEHYNFLQEQLKQLLEDVSNMTDAEIEEWVKGNAANPEQADSMRETLKARRDKAKAAKSEKSSTKPTEEPKTSSSTDSGSSERVKDPHADYNQQARERAEKAARDRAAAAEGRAAKGQSSTSSTETPKTTPPVSGFQSFTNKIFPTFKQGLGATTKAVGSEVAGSVKHLFTPAGLGGLGAAYATDVALDKAADITGQQALKNPWIKTPASWAAGQAVDTAIGQGVRALGTRAGLAAVGGSALEGGLVGLAAYGGYKAGEALSGAELPFQGEGKHATVADAMGKGIYYVARSPFNWIAGNKTGAGTSDLNEKPTGVAGGDPTINAKNAAEDEEEDRKNKERAAWIAQRAKELQGQSENK
jgi:hypothetical protein